MAGISPTFITGANAKVRLNGKTLAYCQDLSYTVQILTQTPKILGKYEGDSVEPLGYMVSGSFTVVRYAKGIRKAVGAGHFPNGLAANDAGNGSGNWGGQWGGSVGDFLSRNGIGNDGRAHEALDPSKFSTGTTFDIQIYQKVDTRLPGSVNHGGAADVINSVTSVLQGGTNSGPGTEPNVDYLGIANIRNCRITQADFHISKRGAAIERFNFVALYLDGDSFVANGSGQT
jgi:hypothetical protein